MNYWVIKICSSIGGANLVSVAWCKGEIEDIFRIVRLHQSLSTVKATQLILERYESEKEAIEHYTAYLASAN